MIYPKISSLNRSLESINASYVAGWLGPLLSKVSRRTRKQMVVTKSSFKTVRLDMVLESDCIQVR